MLRLIVTVFLILQLQVQAKEYYSIIGPGTIRPNSNYSIVVTVHDLKQACKIKLGIEGPQFDKKTEVTVQPMSVEKVDLWIPDIINGAYSLTAEGVSGLNFKNRTILNFMDGHTPAIFVQTDKAMYKPGDLLQFRAIFLDMNLKPAVIKKPIVINVENSEKIRIKQFLNITLTKGIFKEQVQLSEFTKTGNWHISVQINGEAVKNKTFVVEKYVLPKFLIEIDAPKQIGITENYLRFTVRSKYTYGKPVKGTATINIFLNYIKLYNQTNDVQGEKEITINFDSILPNGLSNNFKETLKIEIKMEDKLTGIKRNATFEVDVMQHPTLIKTPKTLADCESPDDTFEYPISVTDLVYKNVIDKKNKKKIQIIQRDDENDEQIFIKPLNSKGETSVLMECSTAQTINFEIVYEGTSVYRELSRSIFVEEDNVGVHVKTLSPKVGKPINIHLKSDVPFSNFIYVITAGGNIVASDIIITDDTETQSHVFQITPTFEMMPEAYIYVHFVEHNNYRFYETSFKLPLQFQNKLTIRAPSKTVPAEKIQLQIKTDTNSYVGLLAVDKSVLLLKAGNDLNAHEILEGYRSFTSQNPEIYLDTKYLYPGEESGLVTLTNAHFRFTYQKEINQKENLDPRIMRRSVTAPRVDFPETWFFDDFESTNKGGYSLSKIVPDTITTWVVTGFSLNPDTGLTLTEAPVEILTFIKFFITTSLPYSIKRGEAILIPVVVYNYMKTDLQVGITLSKNDDDFEFINEDGTNVLTFVPANDGKTVYFAIRAKRIGYITLKITGESVVYIDTIEQRLKVEPEGLAEFKNHESLVKAGENLKIKIDIPNGRVADSEHIEVATTQYILGSMISTISNPDALENLIRKPVGCGEQNMIYLVPNIMVLDYLKSIGKLTPKIEKAAKNFIEVGYQNELNYRHIDGSFSTWGKSDTHGSTWLTAYVMRSFQQAAKYITIDSKILDEGFSFLSKKQNAEGRFVEDGTLIDLTYHNNIVITAFVLMAFLEDQLVANKYSDVINRGYQFLENNINANADMYSLSITAYVLQLRKPDIVREMLPELEAKAKIENQHKWWTTKADIQNWISPATHDNEVTSYMLMALLDLNEHVEPTLKWLISKRNSNGGFASTQETAVGLAALAKFSTKNTAENANLIIDIVDSSNSALLGTFTTNAKDNVELQQLTLDNNIRDIELKARGLGTAVLQVSYRYHILKNVVNNGFTIDVENPIEIEASKLHMRISFELNALIDVRMGDDAKTSMVLMEVHLPSGYAADREYLEQIAVIAEIDHIELQNADTKINIYFQSLDAFKKIEIPIQAIRVHAIAELKPSPIIVYDYVDSSRRGIYYYEIPASLCDICDDEQCSTACDEE